MLAVGNPDLGAALNLRFAEREAKVVAEHYAGAHMLVRADATEARAKALASGARLLHFATHGELNEADPLASGAPPRPRRAPTTAASRCARSSASISTRSSSCCPRARPAWAS